MTATVEGGGIRHNQQIRDKKPEKIKKYVSFIIPAERYHSTDPWATSQGTRRSVERYQAETKWVPRQPKGILTTSVQESTRTTTDGPQANGTREDSDSFTTTMTAGDLAPQEGESRRKRRERLRAERVSAAQAVDPGPHYAPEAMTLSFKDLIKDLPEDTNCYNHCSSRDKIIVSFRVL